MFIADMYYNYIYLYLILLLCDVQSICVYTKYKQKKSKKLIELFGFKIFKVCSNNLRDYTNIFFN